METRRRQPIGVELVKRGVVKEKDIETALQYQKEHPNRKIGDILYHLEVCEPSILIDAIADILGEKGVLLVGGDKIKVKVTDYFPIEIAKKHKVIPFEATLGKVKVCFANMSNTKSVNEIKMLLLNKGLTMDPYITFESDIIKILKSMETMGTIGAIDSEPIAELEVNPDSNETAVSLVDSIIRTGIKRRASDIHIEPMKDYVRIRYRIDSELFLAAKIKKEKQQQLIGRLKAISNMHQEKQEAQDGRILLYEDYNIRVSSQPNLYGEKFVLRLLKKETNIKDIFELGFPGTEQKLKQTINKRNSITIIAGPTGEGKTTTLYSIISRLDSPTINITTIEDPVEIRIPGLNQIEIDENKTTFSSTLRNVLRQDPDIILVGEIRDKETGEIAIQAGQTGHYVLSTIHTIDSIEVITRLRKLGLSNYDIASTLATSISQRLVRRVCPKCAVQREFSNREKKIIAEVGEKYNVTFDLNETTYDTPGCKFCNNTGYYDRIGIFEVLNLTDDLKEAIMVGKSSIEIKRIALQQSYEPLIVDGIRKVVDGYTTLEELNRKLLFF